jgi:hypothetical protein
MLFASLTVRPAWMEPFYPTMLVAVTVLVLSYLGIYLWVWIQHVYSKRESITCPITNDSAANNAPHVSLEFDRVAKTGTDWELSVHIEKGFCHAVRVSVEGGEGVKRVSAPDSCELDAESPDGKLVLQLSRGFRWRRLVLPWPDFWEVVLEAEWPGYCQPVRVCITRDAQEALPRVLVAPLRWVISLVAGIPSLLQGGDKQGRGGQRA